MADEVETSSRKTIELVFLGARRTFSKERQWNWVEITPDLNDGNPLEKGVENNNLKLFVGKNFLKGLHPGIIISIESNTGEKCSVFPSSAKIIGRWKNDDDVQKWLILHRATEGEIEMEQSAFKNIKANLPKEVLAPFRKAYQNAKNSRQRVQILAWLVEEITH